MQPPTTHKAPQEDAGREPVQRRHARIAVLGAGFAGIGMGMRLRQEGRRDFVIVERGHDVGGTWRDNTYPGCACDVPSNLYSFSFEPNPDWSRSFARQPEIKRYLKRCAARHGLREHLLLGCEVRSATWDGEASRWRIETSRGDLSADVLITGTGPLSEPAVPPLPGLEGFAGAVFHSAQWRHCLDLRGKRVVVVGTGASAAQFIPEIQPEVGALHVFQRTPPWVIPRMDRRRSRLEQRLYRRIPALQRLLRSSVYWGREALMLALAGEHRLLKAAEWASRLQLRAQVRDEGLRAALTPDYTFGCKRPVLSNDYYRALTQPNVDLVTAGIREVREHTVIDGEGTEHEADVIIFGTGFRAANMPLASRLGGRDGRSLAEEWQMGAQAHLGTTVAGFPNLFMLVGPNSVLGHNSLILMIERQIEYALSALRAMEREGLAALEVRREVQEAFSQDLDRRMRQTVWLTGCDSWYLDEHGRNTTLWPSFMGRFRRLTRRFDPDSYLRQTRRVADGQQPPGPNGVNAA